MNSQKGLSILQTLLLVGLLGLALHWALPYLA